MATTDMATTEVKVERFTLVSPKPFSEIVAAIDAALGHPDMRELVDPEKPTKPL